MAPRITCECGTCQKCKHREYARNWSRENAERVREIARSSRDRRIDSVRAYDRERGWRPGSPQKEAARKAVHRAKQNGQLQVGPCEVGENCRGRIEAHHEDYARPLDVRWLCQRHHLELHRVYA